MSMGSGMGPVWRHMRTDRSIGDQKLANEHRPTRVRLREAAPSADRRVPRPDGRRRRPGGRHPAAGQADRRRRHPQAGRRRWSSGSPWPSPPWRSSTPASPSAGLAVLADRGGADLRPAHQVFAHVQRMSLAFFTRTQTGALVSRLNNDVIGAQRAFTSTLSSTVSNIDQRGRGRRRDARAVLAGHPAVPGDVPDAAARLPLGRPTGWPGSPASRCRATPTSATR